MSVSEILELAGVIFTVLSCTWWMSAKLEKIKTTTEATKEKLAEHVANTEKRLDRHESRFDEVFSQQREIANQYFWVAANVKAPSNGKSFADMQG